MAHTLVLQLPDDLHEALTRKAEEAQQTPEEAATHILSQAFDGGPDPLLRWVGAFDSGVTDLAEKHDLYIAQSAADDHRATEDEDLR